MKILKGYVKNHYRPEASMIERYIGEDEVLKDSMASKTLTWFATRLKFDVISCTAYELNNCIFTRSLWMIRVQFKTMVLLFNPNQCNFPL